MIEVTVKNLRQEKPTHPWQVKVDRSSLLGNPFYMSDESQRDEVCDKYEKYFYSMFEGEETEQKRLFLEELSYLFDVFDSYGRLELFCWCAPKRCHADTIKEFMIRRIKDNLEDSGQLNDAGVI